MSETAAGLFSAIIRRPVATTLLTLAVLLCGLVSAPLLPVAPLPTVEFPAIQVTAVLPGASPETMAATVAAPLERALGAIAGVDEMSSTSSLGQTRVVLQFQLERNIDEAAREVQAALNAARPLLPSSMPGSPTYRKANPADQPVLILQMTSAQASVGEIYDAASTIVAQRLSRIEGVGLVTLSGGSLPAVRVEVGSAELAARGISPESLRATIAAANGNRPKGALQSDTTRWQVGANDSLSQAREYAALIVGQSNGAVVRLGDVATVTDSVEDRRNVGYARDRTGRLSPAVLVSVNKRPDANVLETVDRIKAELPLLRQQMPPTIALDLSTERTVTIRASIREATHTLWIAVLLVIVVVWVTLRSARAAAIPAVAVPVALIGTFSVMYLCGHSIDNLSLMALTVATGFVVDDTVVVQENIWRHIEDGMEPFAAAVRGVREVGFTVVAMSLSLVAVFIPILAMGGLVGRMLREFSVVLTASILISLLISLTTTPMLCAYWLRRRAGQGGATAQPVAAPREAPARARAADGGYLPRGSMERRYLGGLRLALRWPRTVALLLLGLIGLNVYLYIAIPKGFVPQQDAGRLVGFLRADESTSFEAMQAKLRAAVDVLNREAVVASVVGSTFSGRSNGAQLQVALRSSAERSESAQQIVDRWRRTLPQIPGARLFMFAAQDIRAGGRPGNSQYQFTLLSDDVSALREWTPRLNAALAAVPQVTDLDTDSEDHGRRTFIDVDRDKAARLGVSQQNVSATLNDLFAQRQISTMYSPLNQYRVVLAAREQDQRSEESLQSLNLLSSAGNVVPLPAIASFRHSNAPLSVWHTGLSASSTLSFNLAPGHSLSEAIDEIRRTMARIGMPASIYGQFEGNAGLFQRSLQNQPWLILAALLTIYGVLGVLYESFIHPLTILSTLPSAGLGALLALRLGGLEFSIIAMIGVILLIGIVKKNAIMMIDFALVLEREQAMTPQQAIESACLVRLRPILMTTVAAMLGALPLALGSGDGGELRQPLGVAVLGGLLVSQLLTLYTTPVVFLLLDRLRRRGPGRVEAAAAAPRGTGLALSLVLLAASGLLLGGCAASGRETVVEPRLPQAWSRSGEEPGVDDALPGEPVPYRWWNLYGSAQLDALVSRAMQHNASLDVAQANWRSAAAATQIAASAWFPSVGLSGSANRTGVAAAPGVASTAARTALGVSWEPDLWGRIAANVEAGRLAQSASRADLEGAKLSLQAGVVNNWLSLCSNAALSELLGSSARLYERNLTVTRNRYRAGIVPRSDVSQAETQWHTVQAQAIEAELSAAQLLNALAVLTGQAPAELAVPTTCRPSAVPALAAGLPSALLVRRPDIVAARERVNQANASLGLARAAWFPSITLGAQYGTQGPTIASLLSLPARFWAVGPLALSQAVFDAGLRAARTQQAVAAFDAYSASYRATVLAALQEVEDALAAQRLLARESTVQARAVSAAEETAVRVRNQYAEGTVSYLNVATAEAALLTARRTALDLYTRRQLGTVALVRGLGGGATSSEAWSDAPRRRDGGRSRP